MQSSCITFLERLWFVLSGYENQQVETEAVATARVFTAQTLPTAKQTNKQTGKTTTKKQHKLPKQTLKRIT